MAQTIEDYLSLITSQHRNRPKFMAWCAALVAPLVALETFLEGVPTQYDLDNAIGVQEDYVGERVGRSRKISEPLTGVYFTWGDASLGWGLGVWKGPYDPTDGVVELDDETYRLLLRAKIAANNWDGSLPGAQAALANLFTSTTTPGTKLFIQDNQDMSAYYVIAGQIPIPIMLALFLGGYVPLKPDAVRIKYAVTSVNGAPVFGWGVNNSYIGGWGTGAWATITE